MQFTNSQGLNLHYQTSGDPDNTPLLLIHGLGGDQQMWLPQAISLPQAGYFLIIPDLRGHGASQMPETFRIGDCARDLKELLDHLQFDRANLAGVSMGGLILQRFAVDYPERARSLVIVDSFSGITSPAERFNAWLAALLLRIFPGRIQAWLIQKTYRKMGHENVAEYLASCMQALNSRWLLAARLEVNRFDILNELPAIQAPTLVLVGDRFGKLAVNMARTTAERIPGAEFQILAGGGDPSNLLVPRQFDRALVDFLSNQE